MLLLASLAHADPEAPQRSLPEAEFKQDFPSSEAVFSIQGSVCYSEESQLLIGV